MCFLCLKIRSNDIDVKKKNNKTFRPGKFCGVGVLIIFLAVMRCLFYFVCGVAVFRTPHVPLRNGSRQTVSLYYTHVRFHNVF